MLTIAAIASLASCQKSDIERMNDMKAPVIVKSKGFDSFGDPTVILVDADGKLDHFIGPVLRSLKVGDTIKPAPASNWVPFKQSAVMDKYAHHTATHP